MTPFDLWRRRLGLSFIGGSLLLFALGLTVFYPRLQGVGFLLYWLACGGLAVLALGVAVVDLVIIRARGRAERRELAQRTAAELEAAMRPSGSGERSRADEGRS